MSGSRVRYTIVEEPRGPVYRRMLQFLAAFCDEALLVTRDPGATTASVRQLLTTLRPFLTDEGDRDHWPGTKLSGHTARVYRYRLNDQSCSLLCSSADGLYDWLSPDRPEDLSLFKGKDPVLTTISHEQVGYLDLTIAEHEELSRAKTGLVVYRGEVMPKSAEPYRLFGAFLDADSLNGQLSIDAALIDAALSEYLSIASSEHVADVVVAIRQAVFTLKEDDLLRMVLRRWGAAPALVAGTSPSSVLNRIADTLEQRKSSH